MGMGPAPAKSKMLDLRELKREQIDVIELNEAFAPQGIAVLRYLGLADDEVRVKPNGGSIEIGHPLGASGARADITPCGLGASAWDRVLRKSLSVSENKEITDETH